MATAEDVRRRIQRAVTRYQSLERELSEMEVERYRVCIFGSARIRPEDPLYQLVKRTAGLLAAQGIDVVTGGGPGLMEAANSAVLEVQGREAQSIGLTIFLPRSQELANKHLDIKSEHRRFSSRLDEFMVLSDAVIVAPGGIGTMLELMYVWQLIQVGMITPRPVVLLDRSMWEGLLAWMRENLLGRRLVGPHDFDWISCVDTPEEAVARIRPGFEEHRAARLQAADPVALEVARAAVEGGNRASAGSEPQQPTKGNIGDPQ